MRSTPTIWSCSPPPPSSGPPGRRSTPTGELQGDLILVASGDLTMGGRDTPDGRIDFTPFDHGDANVNPLVTLTPQDPLAGLDSLARQVAAAGIRRVRGDVLIDARLFEQSAKDEYILTPILINDTLIDLMIRPAAVGQPATVDWRPRTAAYEVQSTARTVAAGGDAEVTTTSPRPGVILVEGAIPADAGELVRVWQVEDPPAFARTLLIEALGRQGVAVDAAPLGPNPADALPPVGGYTPADRVALLPSLPFSEAIKRINKVSMNVLADTLIMLLAAMNGERTFDEGMARLIPFVRKAEIDERTVSLSDGRGGLPTDLVSPRTTAHLLRYMATRPDFPAYFNSLPVFGVDGTATIVVPPTSPVAGKAVAKDGTLFATDVMNQRLMLMTRGHAGYLTGRSGREMVFALYVMYVPLLRVVDVIEIAEDLGSIVEVIYELT
ncbi:MAG TPA: D-alanyl-D-alanine carboxypeptidase [Gemmatimonadales bacterium]|nr:D-alanyl-D-alanine carboxypeptidase [Gemmatimonadales bacterium]